MPHAHTHTLCTGKSHVAGEIGKERVIKARNQNERVKEVKNKIERTIRVPQGANAEKTQRMQTFVAVK